MLKTMAAAIQSFGLTIFISQLAMAGTVVEIQNKAELTTMLTDGEKARMNMSADEYVIVDYRKQLVKVVDPKKGQVMLLNVNDRADFVSKNSGAVHTTLNSLGAGPSIAGYSTAKYEYTANGRLCGIVYASKSAYQEKGIKDLINAMQAMIKKQRAILGGLASLVDDCTLADMKLAEKISTVGIPMRTVKNGRVDSEVKSIKVNVNFPTDTFAIPASYKSISMDDKVNQSSNDMAKMQQQMRQYQPPVQQMQQSGQMTPEMIEQMRRSQWQMQQYQQR